jgi:hypothetical protein
MTWTPGPWRTDKRIVRAAGDRPVASGIIGDKHRTANLRLISLAPEMAEWLQDFIAGYEQSIREPLPPWNLKIEVARDLLARARGEDA